MNNEITPEHLEAAKKIREFCVRKPWSIEHGKYTVELLAQILAGHFPMMSTLYDDKSLEDIFWQNWAGHMSLRQQQARPAIQAVAEAVRKELEVELAEQNADIIDLTERGADMQTSLAAVRTKRVRAI